MCVCHCGHCVYVSSRGHCVDHPPVTVCVCVCVILQSLTVCLCICVCVPEVPVYLYHPLVTVCVCVCVCVCACVRVRHWSLSETPRSQRVAVRTSPLVMPLTLHATSLGSGSRGSSHVFSVSEAPAEPFHQRSRSQFPT